MSLKSPFVNPPCQKGNLRQIFSTLFSVGIQGTDANFLILNGWFHLLLVNLSLCLYHF